MINEKKKEIKESEEKYKKLFEHSMDAAYITTPEGKIIDINRAGLELFGFSRDEFLKLNVPDLYVDPNVREKAKKILEKQGFIRDFECKFYRKNKTQIAVRESCIAVRDEKGKVIMYYGILKDITKQKKLEEKLSAIYNLSKDMTLSLDLGHISKIVLGATEKVLNFDICALLLINKEKNELYVKEFYGYDEKVKDFRIAVDSPAGITAYVARNGEPYYCPDVKKDKIYLDYCSKTKSEICVPMKIGKKVLGVIDAESEKKDAFSKEDQRLLETLASQTAIAIENARLFRELSSLKEFNEMIVSSLNEGIWVEDEKGFCTYANPKEAEMLGYSQKELIGKHWGEIIHPSEYGYVKKETETRSRGRSSSYETLLITKNKEKFPVIVSATPLFEEGEFIGTIVVTIDIIEQREAEEKLSTIYDLSREMSLSLDLDHISKIVLDASEKVLNFGNIDLFLVNEDTNELHLKECRGLKESEMDTIIPISGKEGITAHVARTGELLNIPDVRKDERYLFGLKGSRSELCVPIKIKDKVIGVLDAESEELNAFSEEDQRLLETLASQAAIAIENARLLETIKRSSELQKLFVSILSHDLKNPLTVIKGYTDLIKMREDEKIKKYVKEMEKSIKKMIDLVTNAEFYSKLQEKTYKKKFEKRYLEDIIKETLRDLEKKAKEKNIDTIYKAEGTYPVNANFTLEDVFLNLIDNAVKYSPENGKVEIDIEDRGDKWRISVKDWGEGVPDELKEAIFERFERGDVDVKGSGLGLAIVKQIVDMYEGKVWVEDNPEGGSIFFVELPKVKE